MRPYIVTTTTGRHRVMARNPGHAIESAMEFSAPGARWPSVPRRTRRAAARAWWQRAQRTQPTWPEQWRSINESRGVVDAPHPYTCGKSPLDP
jgi:hypothetical protein